MKHCVLLLSLFVLLAGVVSAGPRPVSDILNEVKAAMANKDFAKATETLRDALKNRPKEHQLWVALGYALEGANDPEQALAAFKKAQDLKLGLPGVGLKIIALEKQVKRAKAGQEAKEGEIDPTLPPEKQKALKLFRAAMKEKSFGKFEEALPHFVEAAELDPAILADDQGFIPLGLKFYAERLKAGDPQAWYFHGVFNHLAANLDEAVTELNTFLETKPAKDLEAKAEARLKVIADTRQTLAKANADVAAAAQAAKAPPPKPTVKQPQPAASATAQVTAPPASGGSETAPLPPTSTPLVANLEETSAGDLMSQALEMRANGKPVQAIHILTGAVSKQSAPDTLLTLGDVLLEENPKANVGAAISAYQKIIQHFPKSKEAQQAKAKIIALQPSTMDRAKEVADYFHKHGFEPKE